MDDLWSCSVGEEEKLFAHFTLETVTMFDQIDWYVYWIIVACIQKKEREGRSHGDSTRCDILRRQCCCFGCCHVWFLELDVEHIWMRGWTASVSLLIWKLHQSDLHFNESVTMIKKTCTSFCTMSIFTLGT